MNMRYLQEIRFRWDRLDADSYVRSIPSFQNLGSLVFDRNVTLFSGENGTGKSTLLEAVAVAFGFNPEGGTRNYNFSTYESHSSLHQALLLVKGPRRPKSSYFLRAESFYNVATKTEEYREFVPPEIYYRRFGGKSFHDQSRRKFYGPDAGNLFRRRLLYSGRAGGCPIPAKAADPFDPDPSAGPKRRSVYHCQPFADPPGHSRRPDPLFSGQRHTSLLL